MFNFLKYSKIYYIFSGTLVLISLTSLLIFGLKPGIDFTGGSILEIEYYKARPPLPVISQFLKNMDLGSITIQPVGEKGLILRMKELDEATHQELLDKLERETFQELRFETIGPIISQELKQKTKILSIVSLLAILLYVTMAFRRLSRPVPSYFYGLATVLALGHDVLLPLGMFSLLGKFYNVEITIPIIAAFLTVIGYSVNDTVVIFDRVRENVLRGQKFNFEQTLNFALNQTLGRSVSTSLTTLLVLLALFFFGGESLKYFSLALLVGVIAGTFSSIFLAGPLLVTWLKLKEKRRK